MGEGLLHAALLKIYCEIYEFLWNGKFRTSLKSMFTGKVVYNDNKQPPGVFVRKGFLKNFTNFATGKHLCWNFFGLQLYQKEAPAKVFFYEICEIFKNTYFEDHLQTTAALLTHVFACIFSKHLLYLSYFSNICF